MPFDRESIVKCIKIKHSVSENVILKIQWLKDWIMDEDMTTKEEIIDFLFAITSSKTMNPGMTIEVIENHGHFVKSHTCFNQIDIPSINENKESFLFKLRLLMSQKQMDFA